MKVAIYPPTPIFSKSEKRLLFLMVRLLLENMDQHADSNLPPGMVALTDKEADELVRSLEALVGKREFVEACYFVQGLTNPDSAEQARLREIYLSARNRRGRTRALASIHWAQFQARFGLINENTRHANTARMDFAHFKRMEERLLASLGIHENVIKLVLWIIDDQESQIEMARVGRRSLRHGTIKPLVADPIYRWRENRGKTRDLRVSTTSISAAITIVANISILFTTRDWSVTGTLSTMAGALAAMAARE
ncbi:MAG TPA: hypothetical protein VKB51_18225 [bacterium]|nr:hypothetical protein [bacterium]